MLIQVISPNIFNAKLWEQSGHWHHYADNMFKCETKISPFSFPLRNEERLLYVLFFRFEVEKEQFGLKPMNCPGHCLMFDHKPRSYNELPIRFADFGVLHR
jgi:threonyl-tRNA synthetase